MIGLLVTAFFGAREERATSDMDPIPVASGLFTVPKLRLSRPARAALLSPTATSMPATATPALATAIPAPTLVPTVILIPPTLAALPTPEAGPPMVFSGRIVEQPSDAAVACRSAYDSKIWGVVKASNGAGIGRAVVQVSSSDGQNVFRSTTNSKGGFEIPGLGCTSWVVRLVGVPGATGGVQADRVRVQVNGGQYSGAAVEFRQQ
jgi:hypothetical protein